MIRDTTPAKQGFSRRDFIKLSGMTFAAAFLPSEFPSPTKYSTAAAFLPSELPSPTKYSTLFAENPMTTTNANVYFRYQDKSFQTAYIYFEGISSASKTLSPDLVDIINNKQKDIKDITIRWIGEDEIDPSGNVIKNEMAILYLNQGQQVILLTNLKNGEVGYLDYKLLSESRIGQMAAVSIYRNNIFTMQYTKDGIETTDILSLKETGVELIDTARRKDGTEIDRFDINPGEVIDKKQIITKRVIVTNDSQVSVLIKDSQGYSLETFTEKRAKQTRLPGFHRSIAYLSKDIPLLIVGNNVGYFCIQNVDSEHRKDLMFRVIGDNQDVGTVLTMDIQKLHKLISLGSTIKIEMSNNKSGPEIGNIMFYEPRLGLNLQLFQIEKSGTQFNIIENIETIKILESIITQDFPILPSEVIT